MNSPGTMATDLCCIHTDSHIGRTESCTKCVSIQALTRIAWAMYCTVCVYAGLTYIVPEGVGACFCSVFVGCPLVGAAAPHVHCWSKIPTVYMDTLDDLLFIHICSNVCV